MFTRFGWGRIVGDEADGRRVGEGLVGVGAAGGGGPFQHPTGQLSDAPSGELLLRVVTLAQVGEVRDVGRTAERVIVGVVHLGADGVHGTTGPSAAAVAARRNRSIAVVRW